MKLAQTGEGVKRGFGRCGSVEKTRSREVRKVQENGGTDEEKVDGKLRPAQNEETVENEAEEGHLETTRKKTAKTNGGKRL